MWFSAAKKWCRGGSGVKRTGAAFGSSPETRRTILVVLVPAADDMVNGHDEQESEDGVPARVLSRFGGWTAFAGDAVERLAAKSSAGVTGIVLRHHLWPFDAEETRFYVDERLRLAGYTGKGIFTGSAYREIYAVTGGVPRLVNIVCDGALLQGFARQLPRLRPAEIREVAEELELPGLSSGAAEQPPGRPKKKSWIRGLRR